MNIATVMLRISLNGEQLMHKYLNILIISLLCLLISAGGLLGCGNSEDNNNQSSLKPVPSNNYIEVAVGEESEIKVLNGTVDTFTEWGVLDKRIAVVEDGVVTGISPGKTAVIIKIDGEQYVCEVKVYIKYNPVKYIYLENEEDNVFNLIVGDRYTLKPVLINGQTAESAKFVILSESEDVKVEEYVIIAEKPCENIKVTISTDNEEVYPLILYINVIEEGKI